MTTDHPTTEPAEPVAAETAPVAHAPTHDPADDEVPPSGSVAESTEAAPPEHKKEWYVVKVQSNREDSIKAAIERRVRIEGLQDSFGQIVIPTEKVSEMRKGKRYIRERKLLHGYLLVNVEFTDQMLYLFRETSGVGDFVGVGVGKKPQPMGENEIKKWIGKEEGTAGDVVPEVKVSPFSEGDRVKVKDGMFSGMEGVVKTVMEAKGAVVVELTIFGRPVPVELEYWQVDFV